MSKHKSWWITGVCVALLAATPLAAAPVGSGPASEAAWWGTLQAQAQARAHEALTSVTAFVGWAAAWSGLDESPTATSEDEEPPGGGTDRSAAIDPNG